MILKNYLQILISFIFLYFNSFLSYSQEGTLKWSTTLPFRQFRNDLAMGYDGNIYFTEPGDLHKVDSTGAILWSVKTGFMVPKAVIGSDGTIYVNPLQRLEAYDPDKNLKWSKTVYGGTNNALRIALGPTGTIYLGGEDTTLRAYTSDGELLWQEVLNEYVIGLAVNRRTGTIYASSYNFLGTTSTQIWAIDSNGNLNWVISTVGRFGNGICLDQNGLIYIGWSEVTIGGLVGIGKLYCIFPNGTLKWTFPIGKAAVASPVLGEDGTVYIGSEDKYFYAINSDGTLKWKYLTDGIIEGSAVIGNDGVIYFGCFDDFNLYALNPDGTLQWKFPTNFALITCPVIGSDGTIYFGSGDLNLYALYCSSTGLANSPWPRGGHDNQNTNLGGEPTSAPLFPGLYP